MLLSHLLASNPTGTVTFHDHCWFFSPSRRQDVLTVTPWLAPIVWEGTFDPEILDSAYRPLNLTIGVTAFAVGK